MHHIDAGHRLEQFAREVDRRAASARPEIDLARVSLGIADELRDGLGRDGRMRRHYVRQHHHSANRGAVADEVERQLLVEGGIDDIVGGGETDRVAV